MNLRTRLNRLEGRTQANLQHRWNVACAEISRTMDPEHLQLVLGWHTDEIRAAITRPGGGWDYSLRRFRAPPIVRAAYEIVSGGVMLGIPVALPSELGGIYINDPNAWARDDCEDCGYIAPLRCESDGRGGLVALHRYFPRCPLCGGQTGAHTYTGPRPQEYCPWPA